MSEADITKMKVADLKRELKIRGLTTVGNKIELQERLQSSMLELGDSVLEDSTISEELLEDDVLNDDDDLDDDSKSLLDIKEEEHVLTSPLPTREINLKMDENIPQKKIVLKRNISTISTLSENFSLDNNISKKIKITSDTTENIDKVDSSDESDKKVIKLSELNIKDRLEMRAKKFGAPIPTDVKKMARAERFGTQDKSDDSKAIKSNGANLPSADLLKKRAARFGVSVSSGLVKIEHDEKLVKRQERFGNNTTNSSTTATVPVKGEYAEKARLRLERFKTQIK